MKDKKAVVGSPRRIASDKARLGAQTLRGRSYKPIASRGKIKSTS